MNCPNCNTPLVNTYVCPNCGHKDEVARKIIYASNWHYNQGLSKARVRDLTGATNSLLMSLKYNKRNTQARNLLGLVYFQIGELVNALGEWVISTHFQPEKNIANTYIKAVQNNPGKLAYANKTIQKYNMALEYLRQGNMDVAIIELKKVININPNYIRAYQLMGLLYFRTKQYAAARKVLVRSLKIDRNNITSLRYIKEIDAVAGEKARVKSKRKDGFTQINDPNPVVIEEKKDNKYTDFNTSLLSIVNVVIGVVIGAAVVWLLMVPSVKKTQALKYNQAVVEYSGQISEKNKLISSLNKEVEDLTASNEVLQSQLDNLGNAQSTSSSDDNLYKALKSYTAGNYGAAGLALADVDPDQLTNADAKELYKTIYEATKSSAIATLAANGSEAYNNGEYTSAIDYYKKVLRLDSSNVDALYYIGSSYQRLADLDNAMTYYNRVINEFPTSNRAADASENVKQMREAAGQSESGENDNTGSTGNGTGNNTGTGDNTGTGNNTGTGDGTGSAGGNGSGTGTGTGAAGGDGTGNGTDNRNTGG